MLDEVSSQKPSVLIQNPLSFELNNASVLSDKSNAINNYILANDYFFFSIQKCFLHFFSGVGNSLWTFDL